MNITWDAEAYAEGFSFVSRYGTSVLDLLDGLPAGARVLDLGCGEGTLAQELSDRGFDVVGADASAEQLARARREHPGIAFVQADATELAFEGEFDAVFSNAVLHWVDDVLQDGTLARIRRALRPGGIFAFEMGGAGCCARIHEALAREFASRGLSYEVPFYFPSIGEYAPRLERAGFVVREALYFDRPTALTGADGMRAWIEMFVKAPFHGMDPGLRLEIERDAVAALEPTRRRDGVWYADYTRLRCRCERPR